MNIMYKFLLTVICIFTLMVGAFGADPQISPKDLKGIPKHHKYVWAIAGGAAVGAGIGILLPGGTKTAMKGLMIGSGGSSLFYLSRHPNAAGQWTPWAYVGTNTVLGGGLGWLACNCGTGFGLGALVGGGGTAVIQSMGTRSRTVAELTGAEISRTSAATSPLPQNPLPQNPPPQKP